MVMLNAISVDVEEYFHATNLDPHIGRARWDDMPSRAKPSLQATLDLFDDAQTTATFFVLGYFAQRHPALVKEIAARGHEIASHGYNHELVYFLTQKQFESDLYRSKDILEQLTGASVLGYRAPNFSITDHTPWAYEALVRTGYRYDSSLYPIRHPRYANRDKGRDIEKLTIGDNALYRFPLATAEVNCAGSTIRLPAAGGAYWRLLPQRYIRWALERINTVDQIPFCCYFHPWEIDPDQPTIDTLPWLMRQRHYGGMKGLSRRIANFLTAFQFGSLRDVLRSRFSDFEAA